MTLHFVIRLKLQSACYLCLNVEWEASGFCAAEGEVISALHAATLGREFGHLMRVWPVITYSLSPLEQRAFPHYFSEGMPNMLHRTRACIFRVVPPFVVFYFVYTWGTQEFEKSKGKNPAAYENDK
ncbi:cytochrome b-c1 complex subunit 8-like [Balaenoptera musculus]|uniref:Cytochrome b-c1 complex subunit 8 n=2 Tax=Balaenoptera musculus TaxID=9771 RepID=A0A8B8VJY6_BALMU|nr:cytochrome b-c1 complex subunit 8-like [Balaenoptera musculus]